MFNQLWVFNAKYDCRFLDSGVIHKSEFFCAQKSGHRLRHVSVKIANHETYKGHYHPKSIQFYFLGEKIFISYSVSFLDTFVCPGGGFPFLCKSGDGF